MKKFILFSWIVLAICLFLYSFTQIDLSLTFSQASIWQGIQKAFQYIGYFNRPLSTALFIGIVTLMFALYGWTLKLIKDQRIDKSTLIKIIVAVTVILFLSYNAFSYDIFNYIFDAKILAHYHQNPYEHKALDYPGDPMLSFMHWTHRTYPYGPFWLGVTVPLYYLGFGYFIVTFYWFKLLMAASFLGSAYLIDRIARKTNVEPLFAVAAFALNPLVLVESLVSAHNDIVMIFLALLGLLMFLEKRYIKSLLFIVLSIALKFVTALMIPAIFARGLFHRGKDVFYFILIGFMAIGVYLASARSSFQPWYLLYLLPFAAFEQKRFFVLIPVVVISFLALFQYVPYLYLGNWDEPIPTYLRYLLYSSVALSVILVSVYGFFKKSAK